MKLNETITITPPPYSDHNGRVIHPNPMVITELEVIYHDNPSQLLVTATIKNIPGQIVLLQGESYIKAADYSQEFIENKLKEQLGDNIAKKLRSLFPKTLEEDPNGPGTILSGMISSIGIKSTPNCSCRRHAIEMNTKGPEWCENNIDTILGWLKEESAKRSIPFIDAVARLMVRRAIRTSKRMLLAENK